VQGTNKGRPIKGPTEVPSTEIAGEHLELTCRCPRLQNDSGFEPMYCTGVPANQLERRTVGPAVQTDFLERQHQAVPSRPHEPQDFKLTEKSFRQPLPLLRRILVSQHIGEDLERIFSPKGEKRETRNIWSRPNRTFDRQQLKRPSKGIPKPEELPRICEKLDW
jgi:hypothetical protein